MHKKRRRVGDQLRDATSMGVAPAGDPLGLWELVSGLVACLAVGLRV